MNRMSLTKTEKRCEEIQKQVTNKNIRNREEI